MLPLLAVSTVLFDGYDLALAFAEIAAAGYARAEPAFIPGYTQFSEATFSERSGRDIHRLSSGAGLHIGAVSAHLDLGAADPEIAHKLTNRIRFAAACGAGILITNAGFLRDSETIIRRIEQVLPLLDDLQVTLALENPGHGAGAAIYDLASGRAFLKLLRHPRLRLNYDAGNVYTYSGGMLQPGEDLRTGGVEGIGYLHLKDIKSVKADWEFCSIGTGEIDYATLLGQIPLDMPMSIELPLRLSRPNRADPVRQQAPVDHAIARRALLESLSAIQRAWDYAEDISAGYPQ